MQNCLVISNSSLFHLQTHKYIYIYICSGCMHACVSICFYLHPHWSIIRCDVRLKHHNTFSPSHSSTPQKRKLKINLSTLCPPIPWKTNPSRRPATLLKTLHSPSLPGDSYLALPRLWPFTSWFSCLSAGPLHPTVSSYLLLGLCFCTSTYGKICSVRPTDNIWGVGHRKTKLFFWRHNYF